MHEAALAVKRAAPEMYPAYVDAVFAAFDVGRFAERDTWEKSRAQVRVRRRLQLRRRRVVDSNAWRWLWVSLLALTRGSLRAIWDSATPWREACRASGVALGRTWRTLRRCAGVCTGGRIILRYR